MHGSFLQRLDSGDTSSPGSICHSLRHGGAHSGIEGGGDDVILVQLFVGDEVCQSICGGDLHFLVDVAGADVEGTTENAGEGQHVVDLVGVPIFYIILYV